MARRSPDTPPGSSPIMRPNVVEVAARLGVDRTTVTRWITRGSRPARRSGPGAKSIRLGATRLPSGWSISDQDISAFHEQLTAAWMGPTVADSLETPVERSRRVERSLARLDELGLR